MAANGKIFGPDFNESREIVIVDAPFLFSASGLEELFRILRESDSNWKSTKTIIIPTELYEGLNVILDRNETLYPATAAMLSEWEIGANRDNPLATVQNLAKDEKYRSLLRDVIGAFRPKSGKDVMLMDKDLARETETVISNLANKPIPPKVARVLGEELSLSSRFKAKILSFGSSLAKLMRRAGREVIEARSRWKQGLKQRSDVRNALKVCIVIGATALQAFLIAHGSDLVTSTTLRTGTENVLYFLVLNG